jgi:DHA1 family multidrug resistance protein-like MFS transporter
MLLLFLPETGEDNILHRKAKKLSKLTSQEVRPEIDGKLPTFYDVAVQPFVLLFTEPIALFIDVYIGLANAIAYLWLESFPIVFQGGYGFETHQGGLAYLGLIVGGIITIPPLWLYFKVHQVPQFRNPHASPEKRMPPALVGSILMPICLFWFGWSAEMGANWIVTVIGSSIFGIAEVLLYASIYPYLTDLYPDYAASALAGNVFLRSVMGACLPLGGHALYSNLGTGWASTLLGLLSCLFIPLPFILWKKGGDIRRKSRRAIH